MERGRPLGITPDGADLLVVTDSGYYIAITADERLRAALRGDRPRLGQLEIDMDSALSPREIQARIRAGETLEEVATAAGVPAEKVEPFAAPVLAERAHVAGTAQAAPVRRLGEPSGNHQTLRSAVDERLRERDLDGDDVEWDAWQREKRKWVVQATYRSGSATHEAQFLYDQMGRFSLAHNDDARWLIGEKGPSHGPQPNRKPRDPDHEPTLDYTDEFALVRAVGAEAPADPAVATEAPTSSSSEQKETAVEEFVVTEIAQVREVRTVADEDEVGLGGQLTEVGGVYDIVPANGGLDMIYDLLGGYSEETASYRFDDDPTPPAPTAPQAAGPAAARHDEEHHEAPRVPGTTEDGAEAPRQSVGYEATQFQGDVPDVDADDDLNAPEDDEAPTTEIGRTPWAKLSRRQRRRLRQQQDAAQAAPEASADVAEGAARQPATPMQHAEPQTAPSQHTEPQIIQPDAALTPQPSLDEPTRAAAHDQQEPKPAPTAAPAGAATRDGAAEIRPKADLPKSDLAKLDGTDADAPAAGRDAQPAPSRPQQRPDAPAEPPHGSQDGLTIQQQGHPQYDVAVEDVMIRHDSGRPEPLENEESPLDELRHEHGTEHHDAERSSHRDEEDDADTSAPKSPAPQASEPQAPRPAPLAPRTDVTSRDDRVAGQAKPEPQQPTQPQQRAEATPMPADRPTPETPEPAASIEPEGELRRTETGQLRAESSAHPAVGQPSEHEAPTRGSEADGDRQPAVAASGRPDPELQGAAAQVAELPASHRLPEPVQEESQPRTPQPEQQRGPQPEPQAERPTSEPTTDSDAGPATSHVDADLSRPEPSAPSQAAASPEQAEHSHSERPVSEPTQDALIESEHPLPKPTPRNKKRASVPSWDEIMFGGPKPQK